MAAWMTLILIVVRLGGVVVTAPFFSRKEIPTMAKIALVFAIAILIMPGVPIPDFDSANYWLLVVSEAIYGLALGWGASVLFSAFQGAGHLMDQQAGLGMATWFDPSMGQTSVLSRFMAFLGLMVFLAMDGHYILILAGMSSFEMVPAGVGIIGAGVVQVLIHAFVASFLFILRFGAPVMAVVFITDILLGLLGKTVPQLNVLMLGLPVKTMVSILVLLSMMPAYLSLTEPLLKEMMHVLAALLEAVS